MKHSAESVLEYARAGDLRRAEKLARELLASAPTRADYVHLLGCMCLERGRTDEALAHLARAVELAPTNPEFLENLSTAWLRNGDPDRAEREALLAKRCGPTRARPHQLLGQVALERGDLESAMGRFAAAIEIEMPNPDAMTNLALALHRAGRWSEAESWCRATLRSAPHHAAAWINLGMSLKAQRRLEEAKDAFRAAEPDPRARFNLGYTLMLEGAIGEALPLLEARTPLLGIGRGLSKPEWNGAPRARKTLLVIHEQGMGDTLLMCRFWPALAERFAHVVALVQPPLARLLAASFPGIEVVSSLEGVRYDVWTATMSLPLHLGVRSIEDIPLVPWVTAPGLERADDSGRMRIGLNWAGNPKFAFDAVRSGHLSDFALLLKTPDVEWVSLHRGHLEHEADAYALAQPLREAGDFLDTARIVRGLDLVISTETAVPNLSAAMGVRTCVLASPDWDWRWAHWYPGVTVCAQERPGEWLSACVSALEVIRAEMHSRARGATAA